MQEFISLDLYAGVFDQLLGNRFSDTEIRNFEGEAMAQIKHSIRRFAFDLVHLGYSSQYALTTAMQIVPKPVLFSMVIGYRTERNSLIPSRLGTKEFHPEAFRDLQHELMAPSFLAYMYDQTMDDFNLGVYENTMIEREIATAREVIPSDPHYYRRRLGEIQAYCGDHDRSQTTLEKLPDSLKPYWVIAPYVHHLTEAGISAEEITDSLYTTSDVLIHEQLGEIAFHDLSQTFIKARNFVDDAIDISTEPVTESAVRTMSRAALRGQGYLMVAMSMYVLSKLAARFDPVSEVYRVRLKDDAFPSSSRELVRHYPAVVPLMGYYEFIVKVGDDLGDLPLDKERGALNWITAGPQALKEFITLSGIQNLSTRGRMRQKFVRDMTDLVARMSVSNEDQIQIKAVSGLISEMLSMLVPLEDEVTSQLLACVLDRSGNTEIERSLHQHIGMFIGLMHEVVYGSIVNARFNDEYTEDMGIELSPPSSSTITTQNASSQS